MEIQPIKTEKDYVEALRLIDALLEATENSKEAQHLEVLSILVGAYEQKNYNTILHLK
ncbi:MAG: hypothetical protein K0R02_235 [Rickettsiaceae bacterium]|jgi:HTH-type transcriptional regulator/antitoxin HigA|nr:hypothetical protein [Rickettsiaceae bacterium]